MHRARSYACWLRADPAHGRLPARTMSEAGLRAVAHRGRCQVQAALACTRSGGRAQNMAACSSGDARLRCISVAGTGCVDAVRVSALCALPGAARSAAELEGSWKGPVLHDFSAFGTKKRQKFFAPPARWPPAAPAAGFRKVCLQITNPPRTLTSATSRTSHLDLHFFISTFTHSRPGHCP